VQSIHKKSFAAEQLALRQKKKVSPVVWVLVGVVVVILIAGGFAIYHRSVSQKQAAKVTQQIKSIAVLPFNDISQHKDQEHFCDGIAEEIINTLSNAGGLRVIARYSAFVFKGEYRDIRAIGDSLDVEYVLEGSVRKADDDLRITAQLIRVSDNSHLFSKTYKKKTGDIFAIQDEIAMEVVKELQIILLPKEMASIENRQTEDFEAYDYYLLGRSYFNKGGYDNWYKALDYFNKAVETAPDYALAYAGIADVQFYLMARDYKLPTAWKAAAQKALDLDDSLAETNASYARMTLYVDMDFAEAERYLKRALDINPGYALAHWWYHDCLFYSGRFEEALAEMKKAQEYDPLSIRLYTILGWNYSLLGRYDEAMEQFEKAKNIDPDSKFIYWRLSIYHELQENYTEAVKASIKVVELDDRFPEKYTRLGYLYAMAGDSEKAVEILDNFEKQTPVPLFDIAKIHVALGELGKVEQILDEMIRLNTNEDDHPEQIAEIFVRLGKIDSAWKWTEKTLGRHIGAIFMIEVYPQWEPLRSYPKYIAMKKKMGWNE